VFRSIVILENSFPALSLVRYKEELDPDGMPQFGLIAEEVEKVKS